jgi:hypothetical protein
VTFAAGVRVVKNVLVRMRDGVHLACEVPEFGACPKKSAICRQDIDLAPQHLARRMPTAHGRVFRAAGIELDPTTRTVTRDGRPLDLSLKEFGVVEALLRAHPGCRSAANLLREVWDENADPFTKPSRSRSAASVASSANPHSSKPARRRLSHRRSAAGTERFIESVRAPSGLGREAPRRLSFSAF